MLPDRTVSETHSPRFVHAALFAGFIVTGMVCTLLGPVLPIFIGRWNLNDSQAGLFFTTQFGGSVFGVGLSSYLLAAKGYRSALVLGFLLMAAGVAALNTPNEHVALLATAAFGLGFGVAIPATNLCVAEISGARRSAALNILNMAWGIGAILCPILILAGLKVNRFSEATFAVALAALLLSTLFGAMKFHDKKHSGDPSVEEAARTGNANVHPLHVPIALAMLFYLYIGTESGISGWAAEQALRAGTGSSSTLAPMFFWAGLLSGRGICAAFLSGVKENLLVISGLLLSALGTTCLLLASSRWLIASGVVLAGLGLAGIYPMFIAWLSKWYGERARRLGGVMFSLAALGGATVPWIIGVVSQKSHSLRIGLLVPLAGCFAMIILVSVLRRRIAA